MEECSLWEKKVKCIFMSTLRFMRQKKILKLVFHEQHFQTDASLWDYFYGSVHVPLFIYSPWGMAPYPRLDLEMVCRQETDWRICPVNIRLSENTVRHFGANNLQQKRCEHTNKWVLFSVFFFLILVIFYPAYCTEVFVAMAMEEIAVRLKISRISRFTECLVTKTNLRKLPKCFQPHSSPGAATG